MRTSRVSLIIVGVVALLLIASGAWFSQSEVNKANNIAASGLETQKSPDARITPLATPADQLNRPGMPGGVAGTIDKLPDGTTLVVPPPSSDYVTSYSYVTGIAAIKPSITGTPAGAIALMPADVLLYRESMAPEGRLYAAGFSSSSIPVKIIKIEFMTVEELIVLNPGLSISLPPGSFLCVVQYSGSFIQAMQPPPHKSAVIEPIIYPYAVEVYDAHTGNLMAGTNADSLLGTH